MHSDKEMEDWLAGLAGTRPQRGAFDEAAALRKVLVRAQQEAAADPGADAAISELGRERILQRLRAEDLPSQRAPARYRRAWVAAASFMLLAVGTTLVWQPWQPANEVTRGVVGALTIASPEPATEARRIVAELQLLEVRSTQLDGNPVRLEVTISASQLPAFGAWMERHGGSARSPGTYEIVIEPPRP